jgi:hypothetical protein
MTSQIKVRRSGGRLVTRQLALEAEVIVDARGSKSRFLLNGRVLVVVVVTVEKDVDTTVVILVKVNVVATVVSLSEAGAVDVTDDIVVSVSVSVAGLVEASKIEVLVVV